jgi:RNA polymerase sigma-70 factor, ECF subfamily
MAYNGEHMECNDALDDNEIVKKVQGGDVTYFDCIIERYEQRLFVYVMGFIRNHDEARDLVQNVFVKALNHIESFDTEKKFSSWIYRIAHNEAMNWFSKHKQRRTVSIDELSSTKDHLEASDGTDTALEEWFYIELRDEMSDALAQLPKRYADVLRMKYFEDRSYKEISEILKKPTSSVGTLLRRAKKRLLVIVVRSGYRRK